ncbi:LLM class flavin-dependent oxidoreductase [Tsukamurella sp. 8F]|uniref:LLM class flavin-dependent oxidoreductase n=1 Tax=unclassified Tsukamurella TaxID=2633480 RepID=UPI0023BA15BE|nr:MULTISPECIES: LLM class flavin-dependent oxidoreductase [unclassified Tsukamurella]MDF0530578.1 LLM class flavin-dependent oxidoreductase [Tsukamurella sp. 8J]MDF0586772.1 LLM class flavin-dependent oxidoreductase [Tsukamurella sp. 8F]
MTTGRRPIIGVALEPFGWHPAAFAETGGEAAEATSGRHWTALTRAAEDAGADLATFEDSFTLTARDRLSGRLDAALLAARVAPATHRIGLVPSVTVTHTEPFHTSKAVASLDHISGGRGGVRPQVTESAAARALFGRAPQRDRETLLREAADYVHVLRDLWDSWDDDAVIRDAASGRYVDRERLHYIDFEGEFFSVKGPSITPRPPQGQPVVALRVTDDDEARLAARSADLVFAPVTSDHDAAATRDRLDDAGIGAGTPVLADVTVFLADSERTAVRRLAKLDRREPSADDTLVYAGTGAGLRALLEEWQAVGIDGARIRPAVNAVDLPRLAEALAPLPPPESGTLRARLGLRTPVHRFASPSPSTSRNEP